MKPGTAQFVGSRLREGREARALTVVALADLLHVTRQAIFQYESGSKSPSPEVMRRIVQVLDFPMEFFLRAIPPEQRGVMFYRSMSAATKVSRARAESRYAWLRRVVAYIQQLVQFPVVQFPDLSWLPSDPSLVDDTQIEKAALQVRRHWGLADGPISNVAWLLENNGAILVRHELAAETLDAFSEWSIEYGRPYIVLGSDKGSAVRSRYDAAHELGHMVLHRGVSAPSLRDTATFRLLEDQANMFAGAFLLPDTSFAADFCAPSLDMFRSLKARWKVSIAAMIKRSAQLGLIKAEQEQRLWINLTRRGWRTSEPMDDQLEPEQPRFLLRSFNLLLENRVLAPEELSANLYLRLRDIEEVCGLAPNYLTRQQEAHAIKLNPAMRRSLAEWTTSPTTGNWMLPNWKSQS